MSGSHCHVTARVPSPQSAFLPTGSYSPTTDQAFHCEIVKIRPCRMPCLSVRIFSAPAVPCVRDSKPRPSILAIMATALGCMRSGKCGLSWSFARPQKGREVSLGGHEGLARCASDAFLCRVTVGNWLGPSALCHTLESVVNHVQPAGLQCRVVASSGGGAPVMCTTKCGSCLFLGSLCFIHRSLGLLLQCCGWCNTDRL